MKYLLGLVLLFLTLISCNQLAKENKTKNTVIEQQPARHTTILKSNRNPSIPTGTWYYLPYTDSSIINISVFKYSHSCASYAYQISYNSNNPDSIFFKGYNEETMLPLLKKSERIYWAGDTIQHWVITFNNDFSSLQFKEYRKKSYSHKADPEIYTFNKTSKEIKDIAGYFNRSIIAGTYQNKTNEVRFTDKFKVTGLENIATYELAVNFMEMIPQMDLIYLYDKKGKLLKQLHWELKEDVLKLSKIHLADNQDGDFTKGIAGDIVYELKKSN